MKLTKEEVVDVLNNLIEINRDGQHGYTAAADAIENPTYAEMFRDFASQRAGYITDLGEVVTRYGGEVDDEGNLVATFHRAWIDIKAAVTSGDEAAILAECDRGDAAAMEAYRQAMAKNVPEDVRDVIRHQLSGVRIAHERVHALNTVVD